MSYIAGDSGHMQAHADLVIAVNVELARFGLPDDLPIKNTGDEGHLDDHNAIVAALSNIESTAGQTYSTALPPTRNLGDPGHPADHSALEACVAEAATWPAWNDATGGTVTTVDNYNGTGEKWRVHTFTGNGTLDVSLAVQPFRVLLVGGGGGGGNGGQGLQGGGGGAGRMVPVDTLTLSTQSYPVVIGSGAVSGQGHKGGESTFASHSAPGGGNGGNESGGIGTDGGSGGGGGQTLGGDTYYGRNQPGTPVAGYGNNGSTSRGSPQSNAGGGGGAGGVGNLGGGSGAGRDSNISGSVVNYARGGQGFGGSSPAPANTGNGGSGGNNAPGGAGGSGIVIVSYRIG